MWRCPTLNSLSLSWGNIIRQITDNFYLNNVDNVSEYFFNYLINLKIFLHPKTFSFAMINWCKQNTLLLLITSYFWSGQSSDVADSIVTKAECSNINTAYQKVYSFETENHHINICQLGNKFYYYRQSKVNANNILVPAEAVVRGSVFQAQADETTYFVGIDSDRYYSSVMSNNNEIVLELEIPFEFK